MTTTTLEALQKLPGAELNVRVARELGWKELRESSVGDGSIVGYPPDAIGFIEDLPDWAGFIGDGWQLMEVTAKQDKYRISILTLMPKILVEAFWVHDGARFYKNYTNFRDVSRAIVMAFLLAAGEGA